jgi:hypothetical protein
MNDLYLFAIAWLFFAVWGGIVTAVTVAAFASDLFPSRLQSGKSLSGSGLLGRLRVHK